MTCLQEDATFVSDGLNISTSQPQAQPLDNSTIQTFVKDYVDESVGRCTVANHITVPGGDSHIERTGIVGNMEKEPRSCFLGVAWIFSPLRGAKSKPFRPFFRQHTLKYTAKSPAVDLSRLNILRETKTAFLNSKSVRRVPPPPSPYRDHCVVWFNHWSLFFWRLYICKCWNH